MQCAKPYQKLAKPYQNDTVSARNSLLSADFRPKPYQKNKKAALNRIKTPLNASNKPYQNYKKDTLKSRFELFRGTNKPYQKELAKPYQKKRTCTISKNIKHFLQV